MGGPSLRLGNMGAPPAHPNLEAEHELGQFRDQPDHVSPLRLAINLISDSLPQAAETSKKIEVRM